MKKQVLLSFLVLFTMLAFAGAHKFYVSITEITLNNSSNRLEISTKVFYDDLQNAIYIEDGKKVNDPLSDHKEDIDTYIQRHFKIEIDGKQVPLTMLGVEPEVDAVWCYFESEPVAKNFKSVQVINSIFVDLFPRQSNIINFFPEKGNSKKVEGLLLNQQKNKGIITF